jgi:UDP-N-acetylmuramoyl-tripeptide--D-alanyl-D-alanine ligase
MFLVNDPLNALQRLAENWRSRHEATVIAVTGSVGKTTAKELIATVLSRRYRTLKSEANLNTEIGIPLTLLQLRAEHQRAVLEFAMYQTGDIALLARIGRPSVGVVTNVSYVHLERLRSFGRIIAAKAELPEALPPDGLAVLNGDDPNVAAMARRTRARTLLFGLSEQCDVRATNVTGRGLDGFSFNLTTGGRLKSQSVEIDCPLPGKHHVYPALAAATVALDDGLPLDEVAEALREARLDLRLTVRPGRNGATIIDDSYNASPASMVAALDLLAESKAKRRIAVLGHMRELGTAETSGHELVGRHAAKSCDVLIVSGTEARILAEAAGLAGHGNVQLSETPEETAELLKRQLGKGDLCLIKGSRAVGLEAVVEAVVEA